MAQQNNYPNSNHKVFTQLLFNLIVVRMMKLLFIWFMFSELNIILVWNIPLVSNINYTISCDERYMKVSVDLNRKDFIFNVTFDVKTPLSAVIVSFSKLFIF